MNKAILISIRPEWCELIADGKKTIEVRKNRPRLETPFKVYIYCTKERNSSEALWTCGVIGKFSDKANGRIIGEFVCDKIERFDVPYPAYQQELDKRIIDRSGITYSHLHRYAGHNCLYSWNISNLVVYAKPKELNFFVGLRKTKFGYEPVEINKPPQSWRYVEESKPELLSADVIIDKELSEGGLAPATSDGVENFELMPG